jgi:hypothetical protein
MVPGSPEKLKQREKKQAINCPSCLRGGDILACII